MIDPNELVDFLKSNGIVFYAGVPDSLMKEFCTCVNEVVPHGLHVITANEGGAVALAAGRHLATGETAVVYMQNSGLGNSINPLLSLADEEVYSIPMLVFIGWRGEPGKHDEPQHMKQGRVMEGMLKAMDLSYSVLEDNMEDAEVTLTKAIEFIRERSCPFIVIVKDGTFGKFDKSAGGTKEYMLSREEAIGIILQSVSRDDIIVSTTGKASREVFEYRKHNGHGHEQDFLTVGSMGHSIMIALGIAMSKPDRKVVVIDGDGSALMHMGSLAITGTRAPGNLLHILLNNGAHESVGGQPTAAFSVDLPKIATACGYGLSMRAVNAEELAAALEIARDAHGPVFIETRLDLRSRKDLGRPDKTPVENKKAFMNFILNGQSD